MRRVTMSRVRAVLVLSACLLLCPAGLRASGFGINENSARVMGMGGAFTGVVDSAAAVYWNPAGLAQLQGLNLELGLTYITAAADYTGEVPGSSGAMASVDAKRGHFFLPSLHASYAISDRVVVGFGIYVPYGLTMEWPDRVNVGGGEVSWWGRGIVRKISLETIYFNPTAAIRLHRRVYLGLGFNAVRAAVDLERAVTFSDDLDDDIDFAFSADDVGFGATAGLLFRAIPDLINVGLTYRSGVNLAFKGEAAFTKDGDGAKVPASLRTTLVDGPARAELALPHVISVGIGAFPMEGLTVGFSIDVITWSSYDKLAISFPSTPALNQSEPKEWNNSITVRVGAEYEVLEKNLPLRLGFVFDQGPAPSATLGPELPDGDRYEFTLGVGYRVSRFSLDLAYQVLFTGKIDTHESVPLPGTYTSTAHLVGLSLGYSLDI